MDALHVDLGLTETELEAMVASVAYTVGARGCDHSYELTMRYLERRHGFGQAEMVKARGALASAGICCDCDLAGRLGPAGS